MARLLILLFVFSVALPSLIPSLQARMLVSVEMKHVEVPSLKDNLIPSSLPKETLPPSPSQKEQAMVLDHKHFKMRLDSIDRILVESVPSPGAGH
ncbi:hypothetical protein IFM89_023756 [Coptis chinensis]|uniref:Uncharacterized protein n=1 Tax=Coptis chinensis TaxID=261450 RepID=A0A835H2C0_9MAGN|nr:hypothetical protein IFM89_023756 [Coptis chinensis]